ncbi:ecdysone oxidase-like [Danaus plexippus]|nr:ecdysone oxidase-like [Danaus plexippus]XP_061377387.1 ecdysone oxidase-like [Danaus plexippus]XP_061377388.1 ecdysone oxidase-like [Danaus plexippus]XP_061377389.1 ecdysone oxidase-like [Danaus plexippus]XP_061377390.1 ecdysone oxidase-like [Danaus plexippus]
MESGCVSGAAVASTVAAALKFFAASQCLLSERWPPQANIADGSSFDFIVVGGGTAGSTLAARLSEMQQTVLLIEAGDDPPQDSNIPAFKSSLKRPVFDWNFTTTNDYYSSQALYGGVQAQPRAKMLGGCGSINDMIYSRGFPEDYEEWASMIGEEWSWSNVLEYFKKSERLTDPRILRYPDLAELHGRDGEIEVSGSDDAPLSTQKFLEAFREIGFNFVKDMTKPSSIGVGRFSHTIRNGKRASSLTALLNKAASRPNLFVLKRALVTKIIIRNNTARGVQVLMGNNSEVQYLANREVIVTAGTFNTPKLLLLSGVGPRGHLTDLNIPLVVDLPVGENLHDHSMVLMYFAAESGTCNTDEKSLYMDTIRYLYDGSGVLSKTSEIGAYMSFNASNKNVPDFAIYTSCMPVDTRYYESCRSVLNLSPHMCSKIQEVNKRYEVFTLSVVNLKPNSRGRVQLKSADPLEPPRIYSGTFSDPSDLTYYPDAIRKALSIIRTSYFRSKNAFPLDFNLKNCVSLSDDERFKCIAKNLAMTAWHSVGTAPMGTVLDSKLRVKGVSGLRVADASSMPKVIRGNTNSPVVMIAERAADFIKEAVGKPYHMPTSDSKPTSWKYKYPKPNQNTRPNINNHPEADTVVYNDQNSYTNSLNSPNQYNNYPNRYPASGTNPNGLTGWAAVATTAIETVGSVVDSFIKVRIPQLGGLIAGSYSNNPKDAGNISSTEKYDRAETTTPSGQP